MNNYSPITELIVEPLHKKIFNNYKINNLAFGQMAFILSIITYYYYYYNMIERSSVLYLLSYFLYYKFAKDNTNKHNDTLCNILYFGINIIFILTIFYLNNLNISTMIIITILICITFISFCIRKSDNIVLKQNNKYINNWNNLIYNVSNNLYPNKSDNTMNYHSTNFWRLFDSTFLSLVIYILLNYKL